MKKILSMLLIFVLAISFVACGNTNEKATNNVEVNESANTEEETTEEVKEEVKEVINAVVTVFPLVVTDGFDREVTIESEPQTILSLAPSITEIVFSLGLGDRLVGRTDYCNFPEEANAIESIGSLREPNIEAIIALNPELVIASTHFSEEVLVKLEEAGLTVAVLTAQENFDGVYKIIGQIGEIFNVDENAKVLVSDMKSEVASILSAVEGVEKKSVYYVVGFGEWGDYSATGDTFIHEMLEMAGGENIASDGLDWKFNIETVIERDPEVVICSELFDTKSTLEVTDKYMDLTAVKKGRLLEINPDILSRQGPRLAEGLKAIAKLLHPELFN